MNRVCNLRYILLMIFIFSLSLSLYAQQEMSEMPGAQTEQIQKTRTELLN
jgi:hypothetical protein